MARFDPSTKVANEDIVIVCRLSILIPLRGEIEPFEDTLAAVLQNRPSDSEVLVVHRGDYADPYDLAGEVRFIESAAEADLVQMINDAASHASGHVFHVLQPGTLVEEGWTKAAVSWFDEPDVGAVAPVIFDGEDRDRVSIAGLCYSTGGRRILNGSGKPVARCKRVFRRRIAAPAMEAAFYRLDAFNALGGYSSSVGASFADLDVGLSLHAIGFRSVLEPESAVYRTVSETDERASFRSGLCAQRLFWRHAPGRGLIAAMLGLPWNVASSFFRDCNRLGGYTALLGRAVASFDLVAYRRYRAEIAELAERCRRDGTEVLDEDDIRVIGFRQAGEGDRSADDSFDAADDSVNDLPSRRAA